MNTGRYSFAGKNITRGHFSFSDKRFFRRGSAKLALITIMAFCLSTPYAAVAAIINAGDIETIPGSQNNRWTIGDDLRIRGTMKIGPNGVVNNLSGYIGDMAGTSGVVTVDGARATWENHGNLSIGYSGDGKLTISNGGSVSNGDGYIGRQEFGSGVVTVDGAGSTWENKGHLFIGYSGDGNLTIINGGSVSNPVGYIGDREGSSGVVTVDGQGSTWENNGHLFIGNGGDGKLTISTGGSVSNSVGYIGRLEFGSGEVTVDGAGSTWENKGNLFIGQAGKGKFTVSAGGSVSNSDGYIGDREGSSGVVTVDGQDSTWENNGHLFIGRKGDGKLTISNNGLVSAETVTIAGDNGSNGSLNVSSGGTLEVWALKAGSGSGEATFDGGTLWATADNPAFITGFGPSELDLAAGGLTIDDRGYDTATDSSAFSGLGGLTKTGGGALTLGGRNSYSGDTLVAEGALKAGASDVFSPASAFTAQEGATLDLDGFNQTIAALINSGVVRLGSETSAGSVGATLTVTGNYESNGGSLYLRTILGDDSSLTDKLMADTATTGAGGATNLYIINIGGDGAQTTADGILVVEVLTSSAGGAFALGAAVTAGAHEYVLNQGADQSWYLINFEPGSHRTLYNPNIGSYLGNQYAAAMMFNQNIIDRQNSVRSPDQTIWLRTNYHRIKSDILGGRQSVKVKTALVQLGADLIKENDFTIGVFTGYGHSDIDNRSKQTGTRADGQVEGYHLGAYFSWIPEKDQGPYLDLWAYYAWYKNELSGAASPLGKAKYDSTGYGLSGEAGYGFELRVLASGAALILEPHLQLTYINIDADNFTDREGTRYSNNQGGGWQTRLGARLYGQPMKGEVGVKPFVELNWLRNSVDNGIRLDNQYVDSKIGQNVGEVKIGLQGRATKNLNVWGHIEAQSGQRSFERYGAQVGLALHW